MIKGIINTDNWGNRLTIGTLLNTPSLVLEWVLRNQNLNPSDFSGQITDDYIDMSSFDALHASELNTSTCNIARQLLDENELSTDSIVKSLCKEFFILHYQNGAGKETVDYLFKGRNPEFTIHLNDCFDISEVVKPNKKNIYCQPTFNYAYDYATEKYTKSASITNVDQSVWTPAYSQGFTSAHGLSLWTKCRNLYLRYGVLNPMPEDLQNKKWMYKEDTVYWWANRYYGLEYSGCVDWSRITIDLGYYDCNYVKNIDIGKIGTLNLPHQTGGADYLVSVEGITPNKENKVVTLDLIILTDSYDYSDFDIWQDGDDTGEIIQTGDTGEIIQEG